MTAEDVLERAGGVRALVVGDICLDLWCRYDPSLDEPSRETGIPRCGVTQSVATPGAGGTVARNLAALGAGRVSVLGRIGSDGFGYELRRALSRDGVEHDLLVEDERCQTFTYTKLVNDQTSVEDLPRVDFVNREAVGPGIEDSLRERFDGCAGDFDAILLVDQAETEAGGTVTAQLRESVCDRARSCPDQMVLADSRRRLGSFRHVIATPNEEEAEAACRQAFGCIDFERLHQAIGGPALVVTAGERGAWLVDEAGKRLLPALEAVEVIDICGAGDALAAGLALALACGAGIEDALHFGIVVAGASIGQRGTGLVSPPQVRAAIGG